MKEGKREEEKKSQLRQARKKGPRKSMGNFYG